MADTKISALTAASLAALTNELPINEGGTSKKLTVAQIASLIYPIGSIYISVDSADPGTLFGGTWEAFGAGRVLVGLDSGDTDFDTAEETGGAKTHTLTATEMPVHTHVQDAHNHTQNTHSHVLTQLRDATTGGATTNIALTADTSSTLGTKVTGSTTATNQEATAVNQNAGSGGAHNNLQPYIVVYMFKRTA